MEEGKVMFKIRAVERYGQVFVEKFLKTQIEEKDLIYNDSDKALKFLFSKVFYRGRRDELSERFMKATFETIETYRPQKNYNRELLNERLKGNGVNNKIDRRMVLEVLDLCFNSLESFDNNIVKYTISLIKAGKITDVFNKLDDIYAIGDKLASLYLRDIVIIYQLEEFLKPEEFLYCHPIDTWVKQVALKIRIIVAEDVEVKDIKTAIIRSCLDAKVSHLLFNAGAWMVGAQSFELLIEKI